MNANTYQTVYDNVQELRLALKEKLAELNDLKQNIYKHMDDEDLDAFTLGDHAFSKKKNTQMCLDQKGTRSVRRGRKDTSANVRGGKHHRHRSLQ